MKDFSYITNSHPAFIENLYNDYVANPDSVEPEMKKFFEGFDFAVSSGKEANGSANGNGAAAAPAKGAAAATTDNWKQEIKVYRLILGYRNKGHLIAKTNPIRERKDRGANLDLGFFGLSEDDLDKTYGAGEIIGMGGSTLRTILQHLQSCYASNVGIEFKYISDQVKVDWLTNEMERNFTKPLSLDKRKRILQKLNEGVIFEKFLHTKYVGQKRFSLEGGETTIAALDTIINTSADNGVQEVVIGMAHRGRLNVLANTLGKNLRTNLQRV